MQRHRASPINIGVATKSLVYLGFPPPPHARVRHPFLCYGTCCAVFTRTTECFHVLSCRIPSHDFDVFQRLKLHPSLPLIQPSSTLLPSSHCLPVRFKGCSTAPPHRLTHSFLFIGLQAGKCRVLWSARHPRKFLSWLGPAVIPTLHTAWVVRMAASSLTCQN